METPTGQAQDQNTQSKESVDNANSQQTEQQQPDMSKVFSKGYNEGVEKGERRFIENLQKQYGITPEDFGTLAELKQKQSELNEEKLMKKEEFETLLEKKQKTFNEQLQVRDAKLVEYEASMKKLLIGKTVSEEAHKHGAYDPYDIEANLNRLYDFSYDPKTLEQKVLNKDGSVAVNKKTGNPLTIEDAILELKSRPEKKHLFRARNINGAGIGSSTTQGVNVDNISAEEIAKDPVAFIKSINEKYKK